MVFPPCLDSLESPPSASISYDLAPTASSPSRLFFFLIFVLPSLFVLLLSLGAFLFLVLPFFFPSLPASCPVVLLSSSISLSLSLLSSIGPQTTESALLCRLRFCSLRVLELFLLRVMTWLLGGDKNDSALARRRRRMEPLSELDRMESALRFLRDPGDVASSRFHLGNLALSSWVWSQRNSFS